MLKNRLVCRCCPKGSRSTTRSSSSYSKTFESSSSEDEEIRDDMLYIAVDSDDDIRVRSVHSDSSSSSASESSDNSSHVSGSQSGSETCEVQDDDEKLA